MTNQYILGIDSGTSVVKAALFDLTGREVAIESRPTPVEEPHFGWSEYNPETDWHELTVVIRDLLAKAGAQPEEVLAVGLGGKGTSTCFLGADLKPSYNGVLWNDARAVDMVRDWIETGRMDRIFELTNNWLQAGDSGVVIPWLKQNLPDVMARTAHIIVPMDWLNFKLTGQFGANATGFFSLVTEDCEYSDAAFAEIGIEDLRDRFPEMQNPSEVSGHVTPEAAAETGLLAGTPVVNLGWDVICCTAGVGAVDDGMANMILGTAGVTMLSMPGRAHSPKLGNQGPSNVPGKWEQMIAPLTGTPNIDWFVQNFTHAEQARAKAEGRGLFAIFDEALAQVAPGSGGTIYHPYMNPSGERAPFTNADARGNFFGLHLGTDRATMMRAVYEGVAFAYKHCIDAYTFPVKEIRLSGGGSKSPVWSQIFADICNTPISLPSGTEFGAKGAAWNAAWAIGLFGSWREACDAFCQVERVYTPIPENVKVYAELYEVYKQVPYALFDAWAARTRFLKNNSIEG
jgi:sugar (pentulose or hexulose) kinase